jgi:hypothetical protein
MAGKASGGVRDGFANKFYGSCTESAANTLTFNEINTGQNMFDKKAWILHRLEWDIDLAIVQALAAAGDGFTMALTSSNLINTLALSSPMVIDRLLYEHQFFTAVAAQAMNTPVIRDFTGMPGGGLLIAPRPLYVAAQGTSLAAAQTAEVRGYFTQIDLNAQEYVDLLDFYRLVQ